MKVKQTARKSTATPNTTQQLVPPRLSQPTNSSNATLPLQPTSSSLPVRERISRSASNDKDPVHENLSRILKAKKNRRSDQHQGGFYPQDQSQGKVRIHGQAVKVKPRDALREIKSLQLTCNLLIPKAPFHRLVREVVQGLFPSGDSSIKFQAAALEAVQEACESFLVRLFEDSYLCTLHAKRVTLMVTDVRLCQRLQSFDPTIP